MVLRHELAVLHRQVARPRLEETDRVFLAAASRMLSARSRSRPSFFVRPDTLLGWHRSLYGDGGHTLDGSRAGQRSQMMSFHWCCGLRVRTRAGATKESLVNSPVWACAPRRRASRRSSDRPACRPLAPGRGSAGGSSCAPTPSRSSPAISSQLRRSGSVASMWSSSPRSAPGACTSRAAPANPEGRWVPAGPPARLVTRVLPNTDSLPDPRPRQQVQPCLRRRLRERRRRDHPHSVSSAAGKRVRRTVGRHRSAGLPRMAPDRRSQPA